MTLYDFNKKLSKNMSYNQIAMNWKKIYFRLKNCEEYGYIHFINQLEIMVLDEEKFIDKKPTIFERIKVIFSRIKSFLTLDINTR